MGLDFWLGGLRSRRFLFACRRLFCLLLISILILYDTSDAFWTVWGRCCQLDNNLQVMKPSLQMH